MKFDMGATTLSALTRQTQGSTEDLGALIQQLVASVAPIEHTFQGAGRARFDAFKAGADAITAELNASLAAIVGGQAGMATAFAESDSQMSDNAAAATASADFDAARFGARA